MPLNGVAMDTRRLVIPHIPKQRIVLVLGGHDVIHALGYDGTLVIEMESAGTSQIMVASASSSI